jgi:hypothetical protein
VERRWAIGDDVWVAEKGKNSISKALAVHHVIEERPRLVSKSLPFHLLVNSKNSTQLNSRKEKKRASS